MKKILFLAIVLFSCGESYHEQHERQTKELNVIKGLDSDEFYIITLQDSCEYIVYNGYNKGDILHKPNCKNH